jgi:hypothetical protein
MVFILHQTATDLKLFRKVFGRARCEDLNAVKASMSVNALVRQREKLDDMAFNSNSRLLLYQLSYHTIITLLCYGNLRIIIL